MDGVAVYDDSTMSPHQDVVPLIKIGITISTYICIHSVHKHGYIYIWRVNFVASTEVTGMGCVRAEVFEKSRISEILIYSMKIIFFSFLAWSPSSYN